MPGKVRVRVVAGRNLPVMDRTADTTDAYVELKLGSMTHKTDVYRKSLNPQWNSEWFKFEVGDQDLQDEPLQIRLMDHDTYSANDAIGKVYIDLSPLLLPQPVVAVAPTTFSTGQAHHQSSIGSPGSCTSGAADVLYSLAQPLIATHYQAGPSVMSGWVPVYDTMHGLRGEVCLSIKVDLFSDFNRCKQSSCGVQFFSSPQVPPSLTCVRVVGLVEELVINQDPEYEWIDKIRSPRASNEAKQTLFCKLTGYLQRKIGLKVQEMGANAVLGYRQCFDLEGESGIVVRGLGSAVELVQQASIASAAVTHNTMMLPRLQQQGQSSLLSYHNACASSEAEPLDYRDADHQSKCSKESLVVNSESITTVQTSDVKEQITTDTGEGQKVTTLTSETKVVISKVTNGTSEPPATQRHPLDRQEHVESPLVAGSSDVPLKSVSSNETDAGTPEQQVVIETSFSVKTVMPTNDVDGQQKTVDSSTAAVFNQEEQQNINLADKEKDSATAGNEINGRKVSGAAPPLNEVSGNKIGSDGGGSVESTASTSASTSGTTITSGVITQRVRKVTQTGDHNAVLRAAREEIIYSTSTEISKICCSTGEVNHPLISSQLLEMLKYPFFTITKFPKGVILSIGGTVTARCVKLLERPHAGAVEVESHDSWWSQLRGEVLLHARALHCNAILGYAESTTISGDVCVLSVSGTAVVVRVSGREPRYPEDFSEPVYNLLSTSADSHTGRERQNSISEELDAGTTSHSAGTLGSVFLPGPSSEAPCSVCHSPFADSTQMPFKVVMTKCQLCKQEKVAEVLLATIELPPDVPITGKGTLVQTRVFKTRREMKGEQAAREISDILPFIEYEITKQIIAKIKALGMNAVFALRVGVTVGDNLVVGVATGTAVNLSALPPPIKTAIDDPDDVIFPSYITKLTLVTTDSVPGDDSTAPHRVGVGAQMFTRVYRENFGSCGLSQMNFNAFFDNIIQSICYRMRKLSPCALIGLRFGVELPAEDELQVNILGAVVRSERITVPPQLDNKGAATNETELVFKMDELSGSTGKKAPATGAPPSKTLASISSSSSSGSSKLQGTSVQLLNIWQAGIFVSPLPYVPGAKIERFLGNLNFFFIRECNNVKESGGASVLVGTLISEVLGLVRAHVAALGGNAMTSYFMVDFMLELSPHKNQGQCLINVGGDVVLATPCCPA